MTREGANSSKEQTQPHSFVCDKRSSFGFEIIRKNLAVKQDGKPRGMHWTDGKEIESSGAYQASTSEVNLYATHG